MYLSVLNQCMFHSSQCTQLRDLFRRYEVVQDRSYVVQKAGDVQLHNRLALLVSLHLISHIFLSDTYLSDRVWTGRGARIRRRIHVHFHLWRWFFRIVDCRIVVVFHIWECSISVFFIYFPLTFWGHSTAQTFFVTTESARIPVFVFRGARLVLLSTHVLLAENCRSPRMEQLLSWLIPETAHRKNAAHARQEGTPKWTPWAGSLQILQERVDEEGSESIIFRIVKERERSGGEWVNCVPCAHGLQLVLRWWPHLIRYYDVLRVVIDIMICNWTNTLPAFIGWILFASSKARVTELWGKILTGQSNIVSLNYRGKFEITVRKKN